MQSWSLPEKKESKVFSHFFSTYMSFLESFFLLLSEQALSISKDFHPVKSSFLTSAAALRQKQSHRSGSFDSITPLTEPCAATAVWGWTFWIRGNVDECESICWRNFVKPSKAPERLLEGSREDLPTFSFIILLERRDWGCRWSLKPKETFKVT